MTVHGSLFPQMAQPEPEVTQQPGAVSFTVLGTPVAQGRARAAVIGGHARLYDPKESRSWKQEVRKAASAALPNHSLIMGPVAVTLHFWFPRPSRLIWKTRPMPPEWMPVGKDADNLSKSVLDALNGVIWKDDCQVVKLHAEKLYNPGPGYGDERARVEVTVEVVR